MAIRWLYVTDHPTGTNYCVGLTSDDSQTDPDPEDNSNTVEDWATVWSAADPALESPATQDMVPLKRYNIAQNRIYECNAAQTAAWALQNAKRARALRVDKKTGRLFNKGLTYDGQVFPLSEDDSLNYHIRYQNRNNGSIVPFPLTITTRNRDLYTLNNANAMKDFGEAAFARMFSIVDGARDVKKAIRDATTLAELNAVTDSRT